MRVLILTHPRSGGMSLMNYIQKELNYSQYHEPFNYLTDEDINTKVLTEDNIVVKDFPNHIINKGYNLNDVVSKFDKVIIHHRGSHRDVAISLTYFQENDGNKIHKTYKVTDKWIRDKFIDTRFAYYYPAGMREPMKVPTKKSIRGHPEGNRPIELAHEINRIRTKALDVIKPILPTFNNAMLNPVLMELFSNIVIDVYDIYKLREFIEVAYKNFAIPFGMTYNIKHIESYSPEEIEKKVKNEIKTPIQVEERRRKI